MRAPTNGDYLTSCDQDLAAFDTGQDLLALLDTGQSRDVRKTHRANNHDRVRKSCDEALAVTFHEVHRIDEGEDGEQEHIISTLKYFQLHVALQSSSGDLLFHQDGAVLVATLVYEDGTPVDALSATLEPPLLSSGGACPPRSTLDGGCATFRLRITVLSSLCGKRAFAVRVALDGRPEVAAVTTIPVKTITKLRRTPREGRENKRTAAENRRSASENKRAVADDDFGVSCGYANKTAKSLSAPCGLAELGDEFACTLEDLTQCCEDAAVVDVLTQATAEDERTPTAEDAAAGGGAPALSGRSLHELWAEVAANGSRLLELQEMQRRLFHELRALQQLDHQDHNLPTANTADTA